MPWTAKFTRPIILIDGSKLVTFKDALESLIHNFAGTEPDAIEPAIGLLVKADITRRQADIEEATAAMELMLRQRQLMK